MTQAVLPSPSQCVMNLIDQNTCWVGGGSTSSDDVRSCVVVVVQPSTVESFLHSYERILPIFRERCPQNKEIRCPYLQVNQMEASRLNPEFTTSQLRRRVPITYPASNPKADCQTVLKIKLRFFLKKIVFNTAVLY